MKIENDFIQEDINYYLQNNRSEFNFVYHIIILKCFTVVLIYISYQYLIKLEVNIIFYLLSYITNSI